MTSLRAQKEGARRGTTGSPTLTRWATFDCYGTLIDWNGGIRAELARLWPAEDADELVRRYHELESEIEHAEPGLSYRQVMQRVLTRLADVPAGEEDALGRSLPDWSTFPEVRGALEQARARGWKLAILSNTDRDFIEASKATIGVPFDETVVASEIGSYKPAHKHWHEFSARTGADPARHVHVAQSMFHDIVIANELGLPSVWINRLGETSPTKPTRELPNLERLPEVLDELVAP
jgi:2-haloacid dehalogenase